MKEVLLNGAAINTREDLHSVLAEKLNFPEWYGRNLDALHDCLTDFQEEVVIRVLDVESLEIALDSYARRLMRLLCDVSAENPHIKLYTD